MNIKYIGIGCCILFIVVAFIFRDLWNPGFSKRQTADILLSGGKFTDSAYKKALWHGPSIFEELKNGSENFSKFNYRGAKSVANLISDMESLSEVKGVGEELISQNNIYQKLFGMLILAKAGTLQEYDIEYLNNIIVQGRKANNELKMTDYHSELAMLVLGFSQLPQAEKILLDEVQRSGGPYSRYKVACEAISYLQNSNNIKETMLNLFLNKDFHALAPAVEVLKEYLNKKEIEELINKRRNMQLEGEAELLDIIKTT